MGGRRRCLGGSRRSMGGKRRGEVRENVDVRLEV